MPPYNPNAHHRRSIRLKGYDYALAGAYFITMCPTSANASSVKSPTEKCCATPTACLCRPAGMTCLLITLTSP